MIELKEQIKQHALRENPKEACGFVLRVGENFSAKETPNVSPSPNHYFSIDPRLYLEAKRTGQLHGYYHSHPTSSADPTREDKAVAERVLLPLFVYSIPQDDLKVYHPTGLIAPLEGRPFILGAHDCAGLVIDYYKQVLNITLEDFPRGAAEVVNGFPDLINYIKRNNFQVVTEEPRDHDIIMMKHHHSTECNHCGIYLKGGLILHQVANKISSKTVYGGYWVKTTRYILRHFSK